MGASSWTVYVCVVCADINPHVYVPGCFTVAWKQICEMFGRLLKYEFTLGLFAFYFFIVERGIREKWKLLNGFDVNWWKAWLLLWEVWQPMLIPGWQNEVTDAWFVKETQDDWFFLKRCVNGNRKVQIYAGANYYSCFFKKVSFPFKNDQKWVVWLWFKCIVQ